MPYRVWCPALKETYRSGKDIEAPCPKDAAKQWAKEFDANSMSAPFINGKATTVCVRHPQAKLHTEWRVSCRTMYVYNSKFMPNTYVEKQQDTARTKKVTALDLLNQPWHKSPDKRDPA